MILLPSIGVSYLLHTHDGHLVLQLLVGPRLGQIVVNATRAEDHLLDAAGVLGGHSVGDDAQELAALAHLAEGALGLRVTQQRLGRAQDQGLAEGQSDLAAQDVIVVGGRRAVGHDPVDVVQLPSAKLIGLRGEVVGIVAAHLQEALDAARRVLGSHALHAVGQQHHQARLAHPLGLTAGDELIDDRLGRVAEVSELGLPQHQGVGVGHRVAVLEAQHRVLGQRAVRHGVGRLIRVHVLQRVVSGLVHQLVVQHVVPVREGAALHILTGEADVDALLQQRAEGHGLTQSPIGDLLVHHGLAGGQHTEQAP